MDPNSLADAVISDLSGWPSDSWMVIDDYHHLMESPAAERFVERLVEMRAFPLLILTRRRPSWLTARQLIYGEASEFGAHALAMTAEEAALVLRSVGTAAVSGLVALAQGWPAVIGLAALTTGSLDNVGDRVPDALHSYFAEELYQATTEPLRTALLQLSFAPRIDDALGAALFGPDAPNVLGNAVQFGFLGPRQDEKYELHPLLRQFLLAKARGHAAIVDWCEQISEHLRDEGAWDELFALLELVPSESGFNMLIEGALADFLREGRVATVERWTASALSNDIHSADIDLAVAELLFRAGQYRDAEDQALNAVAALSRDHPLRSRALYRAAQSAQLDDRASTAISRHREAAGSAVNLDDRSNALWGQFVAHAESDNRVEALKAARAFEDLNARTAEYRLRRAHAQLSIAVRWDGVGTRQRDCRRYVELLNEPADPLIQTGLAQVIASAFLMAAEYGKALQVAKSEAAIAERVGLEFVAPHVFVTQAAAHLGRREFARTRESLKKANREAERLLDKHSLINLTMLEARLNVAQLNHNRARELLDRDWGSWPTPALGSEYLTLQALIAACLGDRDGAHEKVKESASLSSQVEASIYRTWATAITDHSVNGREHNLHGAFQRATSLSHIDSVISAYRGYPAALEVLAGVPANVPRLRQILQAGRDHAQAKRIGLHLPVADAEASGLLTYREREVAALIYHGLSNTQIAKALWISESTAKVHVRNILRKLGVRTRTEAAVLLADQN